MGLKRESKRKSFPSARTQAAATAASLHWEPSGRKTDPPGTPTHRCWASRAKFARPGHATGLSCGIPQAWEAGGGVQRHKQHRVSYHRISWKSDCLGGEKKKNYRKNENKVHLNMLWVFSNTSIWPLFPLPPPQKKTFLKSFSYKE